jgi:hypothetical protein
MKSTIVHISGKGLLILTLYFIVLQTGITQNVAINSDGSSPDPSAILDIQSDSLGLLIPRMSTAQRMAITSPAIGLIVFDTSTNTVWCHEGSSWEENMQGHVILLKDSDEDTKVQLEETNDDDVIRFDMKGTEFFRMDSGRFEVLNTGQSVFIGEGAGASDDYTSNQNVFVGHQAGNSNTNGRLNTGVGYQALHKMTKDANTAIGYKALFNNISGAYNTATGYNALYSNTGSYNTATGYVALSSNTSGARNTATGFMALRENMTGDWNTATGQEALYSNDDGDKNTACGSQAMYKNTIGSRNTATGYQTQYNNLDGNDNTATGYEALKANTTGGGNTASGRAALLYTTGSFNTATGYYSLYWNTSGIENTAVGKYAGFNNDSGSWNTYIGAHADQNASAGTFDKAIAIGYNAKVNCSNCAVIGGIGTDAVNVGIGTDSPEAKLSIVDNAIAQIEFKRDSVSGTLEQNASGGALQLRNLSDSTMIQLRTYGDSYFTGGNVGIGTTLPDQELSVSGDASKTGGGEWLALSDRRVKKNIIPFSDGLNVLMQIEPVRFQYNGKAGYRDDGKEYVGVIAQDVQEYAPYMIDTVKKNLDEKDREQTDLLMYDGSALSYILVNAMQEQQEMIEQLNQQLISQQEIIQQLTSRLDNLEGH